jgi:mannose-6-phosphate isomerase
MNSKAAHLLHSSRTWLETSVFPLWTKNGIDPNNGGFVESLNQEGVGTTAPRRAMVQARQLFSYSEALKLKIIDPESTASILNRATQFLMSFYSLPSGAFIHAVTSDGAPENSQSELYAQAFALFGLARSYEVLKQPEINERAKKLLQYLNTERRAPHGGYTEIKDGKVLYQSNPHMHLFEAAIAWATVDTDADWKTLCHELFDLCSRDFIDAETHLLAEHFNEDWLPLRTAGRGFIFEPGHHYEWAWLLVQFEKLSKISVGTIPEQLFSLAEAHGVRRPEGLVVDEVWSDFTVNKSSSRFWPQTERIKAAVELGLRASPAEQPKFGFVADEAMTTLWKYLDSPIKGTWQDTLLENGDFIPLAPKASSLYHIINAMSEYSAKRPLLNDLD